jgi:hypothetical protein
VTVNTETCTFFGSSGGFAKMEQWNSSFGAGNPNRTTAANAENRGVGRFVLSFFPGRLGGLNGLLNQSMNILVIKVPFESSWVKPVIQALAMVYCKEAHVTSARRSPHQGLSTRPILPSVRVCRKQKLTCTLPRLKCRPHAPHDFVLYATAVLAPRNT